MSKLHSSFHKTHKTDGINDFILKNLPKEPFVKGDSSKQDGKDTMRANNARRTRSSSVINHNSDPIITRPAAKKTGNIMSAKPVAKKAARVVDARSVVTTESGGSSENTYAGKANALLGVNTKVLISSLMPHNLSG